MRSLLGIVWIASVSSLLGCGGSRSTGAAQPSRVDQARAGALHAAVQPTHPDAEALCRSIGDMVVSWRATPREGQAAPDLGFGGCHPAGSGAWQLVLEDLVVTDAPEGEPDEATAIEGAFRLRFVGLDGDASSTAPRRFDLGGTDGNTFSVRAAAVFDYDGDGRGELVVFGADGFHEGTDRWTEILTSTGEEIRRYARSSSFDDAILEVRDADGNGRPDLVSCRPHCLGGFAIDEGGGGWLGGPRTLWHALPDGSFSRSDSVAVAHLASECARAPERLLTVESPSGVDTVFEHTTLLAIACARLRGESVEGVQRRIHEEWRASCRADEAWCVEEDLARILEHAASVLMP